MPLLSQAPAAPRSDSPAPPTTPPAASNQPDHGLLDAAAVARDMMRLVAERLMTLEVQMLCGVPYGARQEVRANSRNGFRRRPWQTRCGVIEVAVPKLRRGSYFPDWLFRPFGTAMLLAFVTDCFVHGVSPRKTEILVRVLGAPGVSEADVLELAAALERLLAAAPRA